MSDATISKIKAIKESMSKKVASVESLSIEDVESLRDMLLQLDSFDVTLEILTTTLIGTVVSKFKKHAEIGPTVKTLVKKWKSIAKAGAATSSAQSRDSKSLSAKKTAELSQKITTDKDMKSKRRSRTDTATAETREAWYGLQPYRQTTCQKLHDVLHLAKPKLIKQGINADAVDHLTVERATDVEASIQKKFTGQKQEYVQKARSLCFNLKKNTSLASQVILGQLSSSELVGLTSEQLVSDEKRKEIEARKKNLMDSNLLDWEAQNEDKINEMCGIKGDLLKASLFTCGRCKSTKTTSTQKQTRSADEPMTVFVLCLNCNNRWKFS